MRNIFKSLSAALLAIAFTGMAHAQSYVAVNTSTKVFDQASAQGYVTQNQQGKDVVLSAGMAFKNTDATPGWDVIEYTPGLRGYIMKTNEVPEAQLRMPSAGSYKVANEPSVVLAVTENGGVWEAKAGNVSYKGKSFGKIVVFFAKDGNQAYTLLDYGKGPVAMSYSNKITNFF